MEAVDVKKTRYYVQRDRKVLIPIKSLGYLDKTKYPKFRKEYFYVKKKSKSFFNAVFICSRLFKFNSCKFQFR